jgi:hypothetical protein
MSLGSQEHYDMIAMFERVFTGQRFDKESKDMWSKGYVYQNGETNNLFLAFRHGVAYGKAVS